MSEELMITKDDLVNWLNRPPSNDDLDLIGFITTRLENFYKLEQENKQLKQRNKEIYDGFMVAIDEVCETDREKREYKSIIDKANEILSKSCFEYDNCPDNVINEIIELKEILGDKENE